MPETVQDRHVTRGYYTDHSCAFTFEQNEWIVSV